MTGIGTLVNVCAIILGGFLGLLFKGGLKQHYQDAVLRCLGLCTLFIGAAGGLSGLLSVSGTRLESGGSLGMILSLVLGTLVGERLNLEGRLGQLGEWLKARASRGEDSRFVEGFVTASQNIFLSFGMERNSAFPCRTATRFWRAYFPRKARALR